MRGGGGKWNLITRRGITGEKYSQNGKARGSRGEKKFGGKKCTQEKEVGIMMEGVKRKEERDRECLIRVGYSGGGGGGGGVLAYPAFSVDVAALCGPPHTDTPS